MMRVEATTTTTITKNNLQKNSEVEDGYNSLFIKNLKPQNNRVS